MQLATVYKSQYSRQYIAHNTVIDAGTMLLIYIKYRYKGIRSVVLYHEERYVWKIKMAKK